MNQKQTPTHELRIGHIKAAIWRNETQFGSRYGVTFSRLFKGDGEKWESTDSFGRDDLLVLAKVADQSHTWICNQPQSTEKASEATGSRPA